MALGDSFRVFLRASRATLATAIAAAVEGIPALELSFVRLGRWGARQSDLFGGLYWFAHESLIGRLRRSGNRYREVQIGPVRLQVDVTDATGRSPYFHATPYEPGVTGVVVTSLKAGDLFLDVGANIGYFSTLAARLVGPTGRVIAFEPHEGARTALGDMARRNDAEAIIEIVPVALADRAAEMTLYTTEEFTSYSTLEPGLTPMRGVADFRPATEVHATTLDLWLAGRPDLAGRVRLIKIDVEGAEGRVLAGMRQTLHGDGISIICETTIGSDADAALERAGFERQRIEGGTLAYGNFLYMKDTK